VISKVSVSTLNAQVLSLDGQNWAGIGGLGIDQSYRHVAANSKPMAGYLAFGRG